MTTTLRPVALATLAAWGLMTAAQAAPDPAHPAVVHAQKLLAGDAFNAALASHADRFTATDLVADADGSNHVRFDRSYQGLPVVGGDLVVHIAPDGRVRGLSQQLREIIVEDIQPAVSAEAAGQAALARFGHLGGGVQGQQLIIYARESKPALAWDVQVFGTQRNGTPSEAHLIVDARSGKLLDRWDDIHTADAAPDAKVDDLGTGKTMYSGSVALHDTTNAKAKKFKLIDLTRGGHYVVNLNNGTSGGSTFKDTDDTWGTGSKTAAETAGADAAYGQNMTWDYYRNVHGRNGIADDGNGAYSRVHYSTGYDNAFWSDSCFCMTYGDGSTFNPLVSLDVAGHEMSHGVTSHTAKLVYSGESGGLNEGNSDIFGAMVEFYAANPNDPGDYLIGEKISKTGGALRYMYHPSLDGGSSDCWYSSVGNLDVHYSSGVANHFYYLLAEGTAPAGGPTSPTCKSGDTRQATGSGTVVGIGRAKAEKIWYRALTVYMTSTETFAKARTDTVKAAQDLYGVGSTEDLTVQAAWTALNRN